MIIQQVLYIINGRDTYENPLIIFMSINIHMSLLRCVKFFVRNYYCFHHWFLWFCERKMLHSIYRNTWVRAQLIMFVIFKNNPYQNLKCIRKRNVVVKAPLRSLLAMCPSCKGGLNKNITTSENEGSCKRPLDLFVAVPKWTPLPISTYHPLPLPWTVLWMKQHKPADAGVCGSLEWRGEECGTLTSWPQTVWPGDQK